MPESIDIKVVSRAREELNQIETNLVQLLPKVIKKSKYLQNLIYALSPYKRYWLDQNLVDGIRRRTFDKKGFPIKEFVLLDKLSKKLNSEYETFLSIIIDKLENKINISFVTSRYRPPSISEYKVRGKNIERTLAEYAEERGTEYKHRFDEIQIEDLNSPSSMSENVLMDGLAGMSRLTLTVVRYTNREGNKKLLVSLPENLDVTTFLKKYGKTLSKIHQDFYGKTYKGRPKEMDHQLSLLKEIWMKEFKDKKKPVSANRQSETLSSELRRKHNIELAPITITRWYLPLIRKERRQKIAKN